MKVSANSDIRVVELFAGVGGFRVGLEVPKDLRRFGQTNGNPAKLVNGLISATARTLAKIPTV